MSRLILPGEHKGGLTIHVPRGYESGDGPRKVGECVLCEIEFYDQDEARRHFETNQRRHASLAEEAREHSLKNRMPVFDDDSWNPDVAAHMRKVGERMIREKRLVMLPSERIKNE